MYKPVTKSHISPPNLCISAIQVAKAKTARENRNGPTANIAFKQKKHVTIITRDLHNMFITFHYYICSKKKHKPTRNIKQSIRSPHKSHNRLINAIVSTHLRYLLACNMKPTFCRTWKSTSRLARSWSIQVRSMWKLHPSNHGCDHGSSFIDEEGRIMTIVQEQQPSLLRSSTLTTMPNISDQSWDHHRPPNSQKLVVGWMKQSWFPHWKVLGTPGGTIIHWEPRASRGAARPAKFHRPESSRSDSQKCYPPPHWVIMVDSG